MTAYQYAKGLVKTLKAQSSSKDVAHALITLLRQNRHTHLLGRILKAADELLMEERNEILVRVRSTEELTGEQERALREKLESTLQKKVLFEKKCDESLKGGLTIQAGDYLYDASLRGRLNQLRRSLQH